ncbi:MAG: type II toxin-antitoxin system VapC family toxin [Gemmataceae bacterium]|nr:type II toxin-antitoxin system VapC family toxin [Gemmataceae bacterium]
MIYLLDTNIVIAIIRGGKSKAKPRAAEMARRLVDRCRRAKTAGDVVGLSAISVAELEYEARCSGKDVDEIAAVHKILAPFERYPFDELDGPWHYGKACHFLESTGQSIGDLDLLIAAHTLSLSATLVTNNRAHFERVPGLKIASW